ncbi:MAG: PLP-dependent aminotransferase family protein [Desulfopila sp.]|nr:PLP-dependent aminotransferase family protein [Desulfopila sp.]
MDLQKLFADRMVGVPKSFIREILKFSLDPKVISFAGGLPNKDLFPFDALQEATQQVFQLHGNSCLQYSATEGDLKLRQLIAQRYRVKKNIVIEPQNILILNGAQQGLDLLGKVFLNSGDGVVVEEPGYLGALQAFSVYQPEFFPFAVTASGADISGFERGVAEERVKLIYTVPNFQNPSGLSYSAEDRERMSNGVRGRNVLLIEDDPYGELRFRGEEKPSFFHYLPEQTVLLGSFSKTLIPGFRIGWIAAPAEVIEKILIAKQAADLHTCQFTQYIVCRYLEENDIDDHIRIIAESYGRQCSAMTAGMEKYLPDTISFTRPEGGMFLWGTLPAGFSSMDFFRHAVEEKVVFVPGSPFYTKNINEQTFRLSFSCVDEPAIDAGLQRLGRAARNLFSSC